MKQISLALFLLLFFAFNAHSQLVLNHSVKVDIDKNGYKETLSFYGYKEPEFAKEEFELLKIIDGADTLTLDSIGACVLYDDLYKNADLNIDGRLGVFHENGKTILWFTENQFGCCVSKTTFAEYTGKLLQRIFTKPLQFVTIKTFNHERYFVGYSSLQEAVGGASCDYDIFPYHPRKYLKIGEGLKPDKKIQKVEELKLYRRIEAVVDMHNASTLYIRSTREEFLLNNKKANEMAEREFGILSLIKLPESYFADLSKENLRIARNELFASKGYIFHSKDLKDYFKTKFYYQPKIASADSVYNMLSKTEKYNLQMIQKLEK